MSLLGMATVALSLIVTGVGLSAQARKNHQRKNVAGLSPIYFSILAISYTFWSAYGFVKDDLVLIIPMLVGMCVSWLIVFQIIRYRT